MDITARGRHDPPVRQDLRATLNIDEREFADLPPDEPVAQGIEPAPEPEPSPEADRPEPKKISPELIHPDIVVKVVSPPVVLGDVVDQGPVVQIPVVPKHRSLPMPGFIPFSLVSPENRNMYLQSLKFEIRGRAYELQNEGLIDRLDAPHAVRRRPDSFSIAEQQARVDGALDENRRSMELRNEEALAQAEERRAEAARFQAERERPA